MTLVSPRIGSYIFQALTRAWKHATGNWGSMGRKPSMSWDNMWDKCKYVMYVMHVYLNVKISIWLWSPTALVSVQQICSTDSAALLLQFCQMKPCGDMVGRPSVKVAWKRNLNLTWSSKRKVIFHIFQVQFHGPLLWWNHHCCWEN